MRPQFNRTSTIKTTALKTENKTDKMLMALGLPAKLVTM